jgi:hypothetical protein
MSEDKPPRFFIPDCAPEEQDKIYAAKARSCNVRVPGLGQQLYAISHRHDGDVWFVTVGKTLTGRRRVWKGRKKTEETFAIEDPALVLAIFPVPGNNLCWVYTYAALDPEGAQNGRIPSWPVSLAGWIISQRKAAQSCKETLSDCLHRPTVPS